MKNKDMSWHVKISIAIIVLRFFHLQYPKYSSNKSMRINYHKSEYITYSILL
jgi:hypothetical protein